MLKNIAFILWGKLTFILVKWFPINWSWFNSATWGNPCIYRIQNVYVGTLTSGPAALPAMKRQRFPAQEDSKRQQSDMTPNRRPIVMETCPYWFHFYGRE